MPVTIFSCADHCVSGPTADVLQSWAATRGAIRSPPRRKPGMPCIDRKSMTLRGRTASNHDQTHVNRFRLKVRVILGVRADGRYGIWRTRQLRRSVAKYAAKCTPDKRVSRQRGSCFQRRCRRSLMAPYRRRGLPLGLRRVSVSRHRWNNARCRSPSGQC